MLQFGANDNDGARGKGALKGVGAETEEVANAGRTETVHTFVWYLHAQVSGEFLVYEWVEGLTLNSRR